MPNLWQKLFNRKPEAPAAEPTNDEMAADMARYDALLELGYFDDENHLTTEQREAISEALDEKFEELRDQPENAGRSGEDLYVQAGKDMARQWDESDAFHRAVANYLDAQNTDDTNRSLYGGAAQVVGPLNFNIRYAPNHSAVGTFSGGPNLDTLDVQGARMEVEEGIQKLAEVRITNGWNNLVFHAKDGQVLYPLDVDKFWNLAGVAGVKSDRKEFTEQVQNSAEIKQGSALSLMHSNAIAEAERILGFASLTEKQRDRFSGLLDDRREFLIGQGSDPVKAWTVAAQEIKRVWPELRDAPVVEERTQTHSHSRTR